jgi:hypothetical protein
MPPWLTTRSGTLTGVSFRGFTVAMSTVVMDEVLIRQQRPASEAAVAVDDHKGAVRRDLGGPPDGTSDIAGLEFAHPR